MHVDDVKKTVESIKGLVDDFEQALKHSKEKTDKINELNKQLEDKYSTETHLLINRETLGKFAEKFQMLSDEFENLDGLLDDVSSYADTIRDDAGYNDASTYSNYASNYANDLRDLLTVETKEVTK